MKKLKSLIAKNLALIICFVLVIEIQEVKAQSPSFKSYMTLVIPGDHPDPTLTRIGKDFFTTGSSFSVTPVIYHSTDLVHWRAISQPVSASWSIFGSNPGEGCWGGNLVFYNNKYWHFFGHWGTMYFVTASSPAGPWGSPVKMNCPPSVPGLGMDNSIFIDDDGSWYLIVKNGQENNWILQLGIDGQPKGKILDLRWINPAPAFPFGWAEGPVMWKYKGWYYYSFAINAGGGQKVYRNKNLVEDKTTWEFLGDFYNETDPKKGQALFTGPNHASQVIMFDDSTSWVIGQSIYNKNGDWVGQGRQGILTQVRYNDAGKPTAQYPINEPLTAPKLSSGGIPFMVPHSDFFTTSALNPEWSLLGYSPNTPLSLTVRPGWLRLNSTNKNNTLLKNDGEHNYSLITKLDFDAKSSTSEAGIQIINGGQNLFARLCTTTDAEGKKTIRFSFQTTVFEVPNNLGKLLWLKLERVNHILTGYFSIDGFNWQQVGSQIDISLIDRQNVGDNGWTGSRQGIYTKGASADFDLYIYRNAYSAILAECPANQFGTAKGTTVQGVAPLVSINNNDWALYAGVEFGNDSYPVKSVTFEATASSTANSATIEVWLDSLETGTKIADCTISSTGSISTYKNFTSEVPEVKGNHDVYLRFKGEGASTLMQLKSFRFTGINLTTAISENPVKTVKFDIYPNPANDFVIVKINSSHSVIVIYNSVGAVVYTNLNPDSEIEIPTKQIGGAGIYFAKVNSSVRKFVIVR